MEAVPPAMVHKDGPAQRIPSARRLVIMLMGGALLGKVLGFVREVLIAKILGASLVADSFRGALTGVLLPLILLQNEGVPAILIPLHKVWTEQGRAVPRFTALTIALTLVGTAVMATVEVFAHVWVDLILGGFSADGQALTLLFFRIMALAMPASVMLNCLAAAEISRGRSRLTSIRAAVLNMAVIAGILLLALTGRLDALAWSFAAAFNALAAWALFTLVRDGMLSLAGVTAGSVVSAAVEFFGRLRPLLVQPLAEQGQVWLERLLASALVTGTVASLDYARTLTDSAILLVSQPVGLAVLSAGPKPNARAQMEAIARPILAVAVPASLFLMLFAPEIVRLVFGRGAFNEHAVRLTSDTLRGISAGLWAATLGWILVRMLNSSGRNALAAVILACAYAANAAANIVIVPWLGSLGLGLSEAVRGVVLLLGTALALRCAGRLAQLMAQALPGAVLFALAGLLIQQELTSPLARLGSGLAVCVAVVALNGIILLPAACRSWSDRGVMAVSRRLTRLKQSG